MSRTKKGLINPITNGLVFLKKCNQISFCYQHLPTKTKDKGIHKLNNPVATSLYLMDREFIKVPTTANTKYFTERFESKDEMGRIYDLRINPNSKDRTLELKDERGMIAKYGTKKILISYKAR